MSRTQRLTLIALAVAALVVAFVVAQPGGDDNDEPAGSARSTTATQPVPATEEPAATAPSATAPPADAPRVERIRVRDGKPVGGVRKLSYERGDTVRLRITSDVAEEVHIHGYDRYVDLVPGETASVRFKADIEGIYEVELHGTGAEIASLEVTPG